MRRSLHSNLIRIGARPARPPAAPSYSRPAREFEFGGGRAVSPLGARSTRKIRRIFWDTVAYGARPGIPGGLLGGWWLWERISDRLWPAFIVPGSPYRLLKVRPVRYRGRPIKLPDSNYIDSGVMICELHCNNAAVLEFVRNSPAIFAAGRAELAAIADWVIQSGSEVAAIFGFTMLGAAAARLGFRRRAASPTWRARADRLFMNGLLALYSVDGAARLGRGRTLKAFPEEIWMSRAELLRRYGAQRPALVRRATRPRVTCLTPVRPAEPLH
jgi:YkoP domain